MKKTYIFYSVDGFTCDEGLNDTENCQVIGWGYGENHKQAFENLEKEISLENYKNICCQELKSEKVFYF